jgi:Holliday junction resolvase RusA-like endonuclease
MTFTISGTLPGLNDYTRACRAHRMAGAHMKASAEERVAWAIRAARVKPFAGPVAVTFRWVEPTRRRDPDNVYFAKKFVLDSLVASGILPGDSSKHIASLADEFSHDAKEPRVEVTIREAA